MPADSARRILPKDLPGLLGPRPGRLEFALRLALISSLTLLVCETYTTPEPALTVYIAFFLNRPDRTTSVITCVALAVVFSLAIGILFVLARTVLDDPMWRVAAIALVSFVLLFLASASKLRPAAATMALVIGYVLDRFAVAPVGELLTRALLYALLFVGMPGAVSLIVNLVLGPAPRVLAEQTLARRLRLGAAMLRAPDERNRRALVASLREGLAQVDAWLRLAGVEKTSAPADLAALKRAAESTFALLASVELADRSPEAGLPEPLRSRLASTLEEMAGVLERGGYPVDVEWAGPGDAEAPHAPAARILARVKEAVVGFAGSSSVEDTPPQHEKPSAGFFSADAFTNPLHVRYALKTTAAALFCYLLYSILDWPGIHTCFITCYIVSQGTVAETVEKLTLRILGCLVGAGAGLLAIVYLVPSLTTITGLMVAVAVCAFVSGWIAAGSARISYVGFQVAFAFLLCVVQGSGPQFDLKVARDRVIGILVGNLVAYLFHTRIWPVSIRARVDPAIATALQRLHDLVTAGSRAKRRELAAEAQATLGGIETDLELLPYEPAPLRPGEDWLERRSAVVREIAALASPLLLSDGDLPSGAADRLAALGRRFEAGAASTTPALRAERTDDHGLFALVELHLGRLEEALARVSPDGAATSHATA